MCLSFDYVMGAKEVYFMIFGDSISRPPSYFNGKSTIRGAVSGKNVALWWCQWLLQVKFTFVFETNP